MRISAEQFKGLVEFGGHSYRALAEDVTKALKKDGKRPPITCSHTVISNLANGKAKTINPRRAREIERALKVPAGHIFLMRLFPIPENTGTAA
jgi:hypothetical protein